ncbi:MAG: hypothetical protein Q8L46_00730 [candidate division WWE3 bacterium]|nr:hypothetical protein [candidate division WWE3 bacterium]
MFKTALKLIRKITVSVLLIAVIVFLVKVIIDGKYIPFLINFAQLLLNKFLAALDSLKSWLVK